MASINEHIIANERVKQQALLMVADKLYPDYEVMEAMASVGDYLERLMWSHSASEIARQGSKLERVVESRLLDMRYELVESDGKER